MEVDLKLDPVYFTQMRFLDSYLADVRLSEDGCCVLPLFSLLAFSLLARREPRSLSAGLLNRRAACRAVMNAHSADGLQVVPDLRTSSVPTPVRK